MGYFRSDLSWNPGRPRVLVIACSDGRLQEPTDDFLAGHLGISHYDRLYLPGGGGALAASGYDYVRASHLRKECAFLVHAHEVEEIVLLFHSAAKDGPDVAICVDYARKFPGATAAALSVQQERDARELREHHQEWAGSARVRIYRCEVTGEGGLVFVGLENTPDT